MIPGSIYNVIEGNLKNLSLQTALLESCDWDESLLEEFTSHFSMALHYITTECQTLEEGKKLLKEILEINGWQNGQYDIVIQLIEMHEEEIKSFMLLEEQ
tara:strand:+ start:2240 stop:2539 length:300 start_codon:yes stop_codon:yes gene_type:complete